MNLSGLSTGQPPPAQAPLLLFALMPLFITLSGLVIIWQGSDMLVSRWTPGLLGVTHFLVLGVIAPMICGSLLQLAPVLLDSPYLRVQPLANLLFVCLGGGAFGIGAGLVLFQKWLLLGGAVLQIIGFAVFLISTFGVLSRATARGGYILTLRMAHFALLVTAGIGLVLVLVYNGWLAWPMTSYWVDAHLAWGLGGWVGLMIAGTGIQIIPLFHMCQGFPDWFGRLLPWLVIFILLVVTGGLLLPASAGYGRWLLMTLLAIHVSFNLFALYCEQKRERLRRDAHLWLWQISHLTLAGAMLYQLLSGDPVVIGILLLGSILAFLIGSLLKILPFLTWLDLQQQKIRARQRKLKLPRLMDILPAWLANLIAVIFAVAVVLLLAATVSPVLTRVAGLFLLASGVLLALLLARAFRTHCQFSAKLSSG